MDLKRLTYSLLSTIIIYLAVAFVRWDLLCILQLSELQAFDRAFIVFFFVIKEILVSLHYNSLKDKKK
jgi:hypothetical protein